MVALPKFSESSHDSFDVAGSGFVRWNQHRDWMPVLRDRDPLALGHLIQESREMCFSFVGANRSHAIRLVADQSDVNQETAGLPLHTRIA